MNQQLNNRLNINNSTGFGNSTKNTFGYDLVPT